MARLLGTPEEDADNTEHALASLSAHTADTLGAIQVTRDDKRFCFHISAEAHSMCMNSCRIPRFCVHFCR